MSSPERAILFWIFTILTRWVRWKMKVAPLTIVSQNRVKKIPIYLSKMSPTDGYLHQLNGWINAIQHHWSATGKRLELTHLDDPYTKAARNSWSWQCKDTFLGREEPKTKLRGWESQNSAKQPETRSVSRNPLLVIRPLKSAL